jgi:hypothetical protein
MYQPGHNYNFRTLVLTYFALMFMAALMIGISQIDVASLSNCTANGDFLCTLANLFDLHLVRTVCILGVAILMGILTVSVLMGLAFEHRLINVIVFLANFPFLAIFVVFTWADHAFRGETDKSFEEQIGWESPVTKANENAAKHKDANQSEGEHSAPTH